MTTAKPAVAKLSQTMLIMLVAGNMIGSGIFLLPATLASFGTISLLSWLFTAGGAIMLALVFADLSQNMPRVGGPYAYCHAAFGDFIGFLVAFTYWIATVIGNAALVVAGVSYLSFFFPSLAGHNLMGYFTSVAIVWLLTLINIFGVRTAGIVQTVTTILKMLPLVCLAGVGIFYIDSNNLMQFNISEQSNWSALSSSAALTLWSFIGVESASIPAEDVEDPQRTIPRATLFGTLLAAFVYIISTTAIMGIVPLSELSHAQAPFALAAQRVFGHWGGVIIAAGAVISCFGALNGWILLQGQIPRAAAKDNLFPKPLAVLSARHTPDRALIVSALMMTALLTLTIHQGLVAQFTFIIKMAVLATVIPYLLTTVAQMVLAQRGEAGKVSGWQMVVACLAFLYSFWAIIGSDMDTVYYGILLIFASMPLYVLVLRQRETT